jgi:hypothetical protein
MNHCFHWAWIRRNILNFEFQHFQRHNKKDVVKSDIYLLCTTDMGDTGFIYRTWPTIRGHVELKTTTKKHQLPMQPVSGEVWSASWSMNNRVRASFDVGGKERDLLQHEKCCKWRKLIRTIIRNWLLTSIIRKTTKIKKTLHLIRPWELIQYLRTIPKNSRAMIVANKLIILHNNKFDVYGPRRYWKLFWILENLIM